MTVTYRCGTCGQTHTGVPLDIGHRRPAAYFRVPDEEREARVRVNADLCAIDSQAFFVRGILPIPVHESEEAFHWGVWAEVSQEDFEYCLAHWDDESAEGLRRLAGRLSGAVGPYPESDGLEVSLTLQATDRPLLQVVSTEHPLGRDQRAGISVHRVLEFVEPYLPSEAE
jgi:hypothetical protein